MAEIVSNQIPQELKQNQAWVFWKFKQFPDEKKPRKIPYNPKTGHQAKVNGGQGIHLLGVLKEFRSIHFGQVVFSIDIK